MLDDIYLHPSSEKKHPRHLVRSVAYGALTLSKIATHVERHGCGSDMRVGDWVPVLVYPFEMPK